MQIFVFHCESRTKVTFQTSKNLFTFFTFKNIETKYLNNFKYKSFSKKGIVRKIKVKMIIVSCSEGNVTRELKR